MELYFLGFNSFVLEHNVNKVCTELLSGDPNAIDVSFAADRTRLSTASFLDDPPGVVVKPVLFLIRGLGVWNETLPGAASPSSAGAGVDVDAAFFMDAMTDGGSRVLR